MITATAVATNAQLAKVFEKQEMLPAPVLEGLLSRAKTLQEWLGQVAVDDGLLTYQEISQAISRDSGIPFVNLRGFTASSQALSLLPSDTCRSHGVVPLGMDGGNLRLAMANPLDEAAKSTLRTLARCEIIAHVAPLDVIMISIDKWYMDSQAPLHGSHQMQNAKPEHPRQSSSLGGQRELSEVALDELLFGMLEQRASDLHLAVGSPPMMRVDGELRPMPYSMVTPNLAQTMVYAVLSDVQITQFERTWELDFAYTIPRVSRFRVNLHRQRGSVGAVLRTIPEEVPTLDKLRMPSTVREMTTRPRGLVLVTGPTGSGKSTTLAAMIDEINRTRRTHVVTIEDPIEFLHKNKLSVITQREVGADTNSFTTALRHVLRQDPDIILIGEMRDLETIAAAITAAETGHLVFATLHTTSAAQTVERVIDVFPPHQQEQIRSQLSNVLEAIFTQTLLQNIDGHGRSCAQEILMCTPAVRNLIREGKVHQIPSVIQASAKYGMQTLDSSLKQLILNRRVSFEAALEKSSNPDDFKAFVAME